MGISRRKLLSAGLAVTGAVGTACRRRRATPGKAPLRVSVGPYLTMCPLYLAWERGYFHDEGIEVELVPVPSSSHAIPLLAGGEIDVSLLSVSASLINAVSKGARIRIVLGREILSPECPWVIAVYGSSSSFPEGLNSARQLKGKKVAVRRTARFSVFMLDNLLRSAGLTLHDVELHPMRMQEALAALIGGLIDATTGAALQFSHALASDKIVPGIPLARILPNFQYSFVLFGQTLLAADVATGVRFLTAYLRAGRDFLAGETPQFMDDYSERNDLDPRAVRSACRATYRLDGEIVIGDVQKTIDWHFARGTVEQPLQAAELIDTRYLERVRKGTVS